MRKRMSDTPPTHVDAEANLDDGTRIPKARFRHRALALPPCAGHGSSEKSPGSGSTCTHPSWGAACDTEDLRCSNDCNLDIVCHGGVWEWLNGYCPVCASPNTPIATPIGDRPIAELREGDLVYSVERGAIVAVPIVRVTRTPVHGRHVVRVQLVSGETLEISA